MNLRKILATILFTTLFAGLVACNQNATAQASPQTLPASSQASPQQKQSEKKDDETNFDTQLYLLVATNQEVDNTKLPPALEAVVKQLRGWLPFKNYRVASTLINRVRNGGHLNLKWIGDPLFASATAPAPTLTPSFNDFSVNSVRLIRDSADQEYIRMDQFRFGSSVPIQTGQMAALTSPGFPASSGFPVINYEPTGLNTDISIREGEPAIVGTLNVGPSGDLIILVITARRTLK